MRFYPVGLCDKSGSRQRDPNTPIFSSMTDQSLHLLPCSLRSFIFSLHENPMNEKRTELYVKPKYHVFNLERQANSFIRLLIESHKCSALEVPRYLPLAGRALVLLAADCCRKKQISWGCRLARVEQLGTSSIFIMAR